VCVVTEQYPKLRPLDIKPYQQDDHDMLLLRDPLELTDQMLGVPQQLAPLLALCDGTRDLVGIHTALTVRWGVRIKAGMLHDFVNTLDEACLLDNARARAAKQAALEAYRALPSRPPSLAGGGYPADPKELTPFLRAFDASHLTNGRSQTAAGTVRGVVSPHIDYARGGPVYKAVWGAAEKATREADLAIIFGTDHSGGLGKITLTRQSYATPYGVLPTATEIVDRLAAALGDEAAFAEELHHRKEHSIELAAVWLHHARGGRAIQVVPVLCGSFAHFVAGQADPAADPAFATVISVLREAMAGRKALVVAAADLAHVGPAFDGRPVEAEGQAKLRESDEAILREMAAGNAERFFNALKAVEDNNNVCGLPPIYMSLRLLGETRGEMVAYDQCPADDADTSWVSIAGMLWR
jgi:AmmeMemoRadiSam system protein B